MIQELRPEAASFYLNVSYVGFARENKMNKQAVKSEDIFFWEVILFPHQDV